MTFQPHGQRPHDEKTLQIIWIALLFSNVLYVVVCHVVKEMKFIAPQLGELNPIEILALASNLALLGLYLFYHKKVIPLKERNQISTLSIKCWALTEVVTLLGFIASFLSENNNSFFILANGLTGTVALLMMSPKKSS